MIGQEKNPPVKHIKIKPNWKGEWPILSHELYQPSNKKTQSSDCYHNNNIGRPAVELNSNNNFLSSYIICIRTMSTSISYLVLFDAAMRAVRIATAVWIALLKTSSMVARYTKVLTTAMKESQKSINWNIFLLSNQYYLMLKLLRERERFKITW